MPLQRISHAGAAPPTNLLSAITATAMSFALTSSTGYPTGSGGPFVLDIDGGEPTEEKILCSSLSGGTVTVAAGGRGWDNTIAVAHSPGTALAPSVTLIFSAAEADDANAHIYDITRNDHPQYAGANGASAVATYVTNSAGQAVGVGAAVVRFDTIVWGGNYNPTTFTFTSPVGGLYRVEASIAGLASSQLAILYNGGIVFTGAPAETNNDVYASAPMHRCLIAATVQCQAGSTLQVQVNTAQAGTLIPDTARCYAQYTQVH